MSRNNPQTFLPNGENDDQIPSRRGRAKKLPALFVPDILCGNNRVGPLNGLLDFDRLNSVPVNMANIVKIPIEGLNAIQQTKSIYGPCIYSKRPPAPCGTTRRSG